MISIESQPKKIGLVVVVLVVAAAAAAAISVGYRNLTLKFGQNHINYY